MTSLSISKKLYEATGWDDTDFDWLIDKLDDEYTKPPEVGYRTSRKSEIFDFVPAYSSDYLLEKLPSIINETSLTLSSAYGTGTWFSSYQDYKVNGMTVNYLTVADTPADALALLAIKLFKQGILERVDKDE